MVEMPTAWADSHRLQSLDRGHRILIERGFQLQALTFDMLDKLKDPESLQNWNNSHYTTIDLGRQVPPEDLETSETIPWTTWIANSETPEASLPDHIFEQGKDQQLVSWQFKDEQDIGKPEEIEQLQAWINHYRPLLPNTLLYTNQHGDSRFEGYGSVNDNELTNYMWRIKPDILMQDTYPYGVSRDLLNEGGRPRQYYFALNRYRTFALAGNDGSGDRPIPYGVWIQMFKGGLFGRFPSQSEISLQQFSALAFGCKMISTFTYNNYADVGGGFSAPLFSQPFGKGATPVFDHLSKINRQTQILGQTLVRLISTDIRIVSKPASLMDLFFKGIQEWQPDDSGYMTSIEAKNLGPANSGQRGDVLLGSFHTLLESFDGPFEDQEYFMLTNGLASRKYSPSETQQSITVVFDFQESGITGLQRLNRTTGNIDKIEAGWREDIGAKETSTFTHLGDTRYQLQLVLNGGEGDLFKFATGAPFIGIDS